MASKTTSNLEMFSLSKMAGIKRLSLLKDSADSEEMDVADEDEEDAGGEEPGDAKEPTVLWLDMLWYLFRTRFAERGVVV